MKIKVEIVPGKFVYLSRTEKIIFDELNNADTYITSVEIAKKIGSTKISVKSFINQMRDVLEENNVFIIPRRGKYRIVKAVVIS